MTERDEEVHPRGIVIVDAVWKYFPIEWQTWAGAYFNRPPPESLRKIDQKAYDTWPVNYPGDPPDGPPSSWTWLDGDARKLWHFYPTNREPNHAAVPQDNRLQSIWLVLRRCLGSSRLVASGFREGSLKREDIPAEAWERLAWDLDVCASCVKANDVRITEIRIRPRATASRLEAEKSFALWSQEQARIVALTPVKHSFLAEALSRFPGLSMRGAVRVWNRHAPPRWRRPGRRQS